ncbi:MAG: hypothetical protein GOP50_01760 [Candidatus Heimdallarchaeota archaeon]|nr:hypothetical protein [Candidatus Heimdallarchaeota archaeon]
MPRDVLEKKPLTISEAMGILQGRSEESELSYWQRVAFEHAMQNARIEPAESRKIVKELIKKHKISELSAFTIANILPPSIEELKDLLSKEPKILKDEEIKEIFNIIKPFADKYENQK